MARRNAYPGILDADQRFEAMRAGMDRLRTLELAQAVPSAAAQALDHAVIAVRMAANLLTSRLEFFELQRRGAQNGYARAVAELEIMRPLVVELNRMADAYHPASPESRTLNHAAQAMRMAADVLSGRPDFYGMTSRTEVALSQR